MDVDDGTSASCVFDFGTIWFIFQTLSLLPLRLDIRYVFHTTSYPEWIPIRVFFTRPLRHSQNKLFLKLLPVLVLGNLFRLREPNAGPSVSESSTFTMVRCFLLFLIDYVLKFLISFRRSSWTFRRHRPQYHSTRPWCRDQCHHRRNYGRRS